MDTVEIITVAIGAVTIFMLGTLIVLLRTWYVVERRPAKAAPSAHGSIPAEPDDGYETKQAA